MAKKVELNGKTYRISTQQYGYSKQQLFVNGEGSSIKMWNNDLDNIESWKKYAREAIEEYEYRLAAKKEFSSWDGKL